ncbi:MAG: hypothetical protein HYU55_07945 [Nocardioides sp.]|nr:hypothetical protein [Nocardioides sp.]
MKTIPALVFAAVLAVGLLGGVAAYQVAAGPVGAGSSPTASTGAAPVVARTRHARPKVRWAPCQPPAVRRGKACVTEEVRTVVVPAPAPAAPAPAAPATRPVRAGGDDHGDDRAEDHGDDHAEDHGDDHGDDHGEDHGDDGGEHEDD